MKEFVEKVRSFLAEKNQDGYEFSGWMEYYLFHHYDEMRKDAPEATDLLNEELPDICAEMEPGDDDTEFREKVKFEFEKAMVFYNQ